jgi:hypothetical protein
LILTNQMLVGFPQVPPFAALARLYVYDVL